MFLLAFVAFAVTASASASPRWLANEAKLPFTNELKLQDFNDETVALALARMKEIYNTLQTLEELSQESVDPRIQEDAILTTPELIKKYGYPSETHDIITEDGYILTYHRIPHGKNSITTIPNSRPLILQHGLMSSSDDWIITGPEYGFGYILADAGYDVWIGNARGNKWSRRHTSLDPKKGDFWNFSWHEMGVYDLPAAIDYILENTGKESLHYIGHSMGTTMFTVMGSERPEYNKKIRAAALLAPAVFFEYNNDPFYQSLSPFLRQLDIISELLGINELFKHHYIYTVLGDKLCKETDPTFPLCLAAAGFVGVNTEYMNTTMIPIFLGHFPSGAATKDWLHYGQSIESGDFRQYDHGAKKNMIIYGDPQPPKYDVTKVTAPVAIHYAENDGTIMPEDVATLVNLLPTVIDCNKVPSEIFNHLDFVIAIPAKELVYNLVISQMDQY